MGYSPGGAKSQTQLSMNAHRQWVALAFLANFQLVLQENCFTCEFIFDVFVERDEHHVLLPHHLMWEITWETNKKCLCMGYSLRTHDFFEDFLMILTEQSIKIHCFS